MRNVIRIGSGLIILLVLGPATGRAQTAEKVRGNVIGEWRSYGADLASTKYAPLDQINRSNVNTLQTAWRWASIDNPILAARGLWTWKNEATPLMVDGVLYTSTSLSQVAAIDARTGTTLWGFDPEMYVWGAPTNHGFVHRGVAYWEDGEDRRIFIGTGDAYLIALDAATGQPIQTFGDDGRIDLTKGLRRAINRRFYGVSSPPILCNDVVIVGSSILDYPAVREMPPGDVRGFDARTGELRWIFESIPQALDEGFETWEQQSWEHSGNTNVWPPMSCDAALGMVYLPFGTPNNDYYGGHRPGDNLYAESLVAVDAATGDKVWHYQLVHHGIWDYDLPAAPNLVDITVDGQPIQAVVQVAKHGFAFVFDRATGEPVWPIEERPAPQSTISGEQTSPTQPVPTKPLPFDQQGMTEDDLIDFTTALRNEARTIMNRFTHGPLFTPPVGGGTIHLPGVAGSASWSGAAVDSEKGILYVPSITSPFILRIQFAADNPHYDYTGYFEYGPIGPQGLPLMKPPYGRITAIDLNTGEHLWMSPVGEGPRNHAAIRHLNLPRLGWDRRIFPLLTQSLLFAGQEGLTWSRGDSPIGAASETNSRNADPYLRVFDPDTGEELAQIPLPGNATGAPITYMVAGQQYIVVPIGGASQPAELVALTLGGATGIDDAFSEEIELHQNYPNPFQGTTTIDYILPAPTHVELTVYDVLGRRVKRLVDEVRVAGRHQARFDAAGLPSGLYFYRFNTDSFSQTRQLVVVR